MNWVAYKQCFFRIVSTIFIPKVGSVVILEKQKLLWQNAFKKKLWFIFV